MAGEARLAKNIRDIAGNSQIAIYQGIVSKVDGSSCTIYFTQCKSTIKLRSMIFFGVIVDTLESRRK